VSWVVNSAQVKVTPTHLLVEHAVVALVALWLLRKLLSTSKHDSHTAFHLYILRFGVMVCVCMPLYFVGHSTIVDHDPLCTGPKQVLAGVVNFVLKFAPGAQVSG